MTPPIFPEKLIQPSFVTPEQYLASKKRRSSLSRLGENAICCFSRQFFERITKAREFEEKEWAGYRLAGSTKSDQTDLVLIQGIGAPCAVAQIEEMIVGGIRRCIVVGMAGSLSDRLKIGDIVLCDRAIRDEGTSAHYLPASHDVTASTILTDKIETNCRAKGIAFRKGTSWTTDAPYRETKMEVDRFSADGVCCVEMEAAAMFALGKYRKIEVAALFVVSDCLIGPVWRPHFGGKAVQQGMELAFDLALATYRSIAIGSFNQVSR